MNLRLITTIALALIVSACGGDSSDGSGVESSQSNLTGRVDSRAGNQSAAPGMADPGADRQSTIQTADRVVARDGEGNVIAEAAVEADGSYTFPDVPRTEGTVRIEALAGDVIVGGALVPGGVGSSPVTAMPISAETTAEAEAYAALLADGHAAAEIDAIGLMEGITAEMASHVADGEAFAQGAWSAQTAFYGGLQAEGVDANAAAAVEARADEFNSLAAAIDGSADAEGAWAAYERGACDALEALGASPSAQVTAEAAAGYAMVGELDDSAAGEAAAAASAEAIADAERMAQAGFAAELPEIRARIESVYGEFDAAIAAAGSVDDLRAAHAELTAALRSDDGDSILDAVLVASANIDGLEGLGGLGLDGLEGLLAEVLAQVNEAITTALGALDEALAELEAYGDAGSIFAEFRAQIEAALGAELASVLDADGQGLAIELTAAAEGNAGAFLDGDVPDVE